MPGSETPSPVSTIGSGYEELRGSWEETGIEHHVLDISSIVDGFTAQRISFDEAVEATADLWGNEFNRQIRLQEHIAKNGGEIIQIVLPKIPKEAFMTLIYLGAPDREAFFSELNDPSATRDERLIRLDALMSQTLKGYYNAGPTVAKINRYTGLSSLQAFDALMRIRSKFDTDEPITLPTV